MGILIGLLIVMEVLVSILLIGIILLQKSREQGLGLAFGANVGESLFGSRAGNVLTKGTIILGSIFAANTLLIGVLYAGRGGSLVEQNQGRESAPPVSMEEPAASGLAPDSGAASTPQTVDLTGLAESRSADNAQNMPEASRKQEGAEAPAPESSPSN